MNINCTGIPCRDEHGSGLDRIRTEVNLGDQEWTALHFFENWRTAIFLKIGGSGLDHVEKIVLFSCDYSSRIKSFRCNVILQIC